MTFAIDGNKNFIEKPRVTEAKLAASNFLGKLLTELETPPPFSFMSENNAACSQQFFEVTETQDKAKV
jgi:hypothetical protein